MATRTQRKAGTKSMHQRISSPAHVAPGQYGEIKLFAGSAYQAFGEEVARYLGLDMCRHYVTKFSNDNIFVRLNQSARGQDVYLIQGMCSPVSDSIMELLITIDTLKRDSAGRITAVIPYYSYGRSDKKDQPRVPITARLLADMIQVAGADRYLGIDFHAAQIQGFFSIPGDVLSAMYIITDYFRKKQLENAVVVSTDLGFAKKGRNYAARLKMPLAVIEKRRLINNETQALSLIGNVEGKDAIIIDDEVDTAGSIMNAANLVKEQGARDIYLAFTHSILSGPALERLRNLPIREIVTTNTLPIPDDKRMDNMTVLSIAPLVGEVIKRSHEGRSVGELFDE